jgi:hypothetical protein
VTRRKIICRVPGCAHWALPRVNETQLGPIEDTEVLCREHWQSIPIRFRRVYRRARSAFFADTTEVNHERCRRLWAWLTRTAIERSVGI